MAKNYLSKDRLEELKAELQNLKTVKRMEIAEQLKRAKEYGDLSENSEYAEARDEQSRVEARIFELEEFLKEAVLIEKRATTGGIVQVGSKVTLKKDGKSIEYSIVGSSESKPEEGMISNESPIGRAVLDHIAGDTVEVTTPSGKVKYQITKVE